MTGKREKPEKIVAMLTDVPSIMMGNVNLTS